ncbi:MAG: GGDEF domain-containing protein [Candidatus Omnitrophota bacterium]
MFSLKFDKQHNLLTITLRNNFDMQQGELLFKRLEKEMPRVKNGFMVLTDLSSLDTFDPLSYQYVQKIMTLCNTYGVSKIFRVIPDKTKDFGFNIMSIFHYSKNVEIHTYKSIEEANYHIRLNTNITFRDRVITILKIIKIQTTTLSKHSSFRLSVIISGFIILIILRQLFHAFGVSLGYLYITLIALSGFWFETRGGIIAALMATIIFLIEINIFNAWFSRDIVLKSMFLRFMIYFLSGITIGYQSQSEKKLRNKLEFLAVHDELTGFLNFRFSLELLKKEFQRSKRHSTNLTIAIIDIDYFKNINDSYGHLVGNDSIKTFSLIIKNNLRETDIAGRYGGDEFILIFPESNAEQGMKILTRIKKSLSTMEITSDFLINNKSITLTFSAGLASFSSHNKTMNDLIDSADKALYQAKKEGRNKILINYQTAL